MTTCPGQLSLEISTVEKLFFFINSFTSFISEPSTAAIAPSPILTAFCIAIPLARSIIAASVSFKEPLHTNAVYSPKE